MALMDHENFVGFFFLNNIFFIFSIFLFSFFYFVLFIFVVFIFLDWQRWATILVSYSKKRRISRRATRCRLLSFVVIRCTTRCHSFYHSLSFVITRCHRLSLVVTHFHSLSLDVPLVCLFINDQFDLKLETF